MRALVALLATTAALAQANQVWGDATATLRDACFDCHGGDATKGGFDLGVDHAGSALGRLWAIARVRERVRTCEMPPPGADAPDAVARAAILAHCDAELARGIPTLAWPAGRVTIRRLSRTQWQNSVRDLFSLATPLTAGFPTDDLGYGFDTIGDALSFSTLHLEKYLAAAEAIADELTLDRDPRHAREQAFEPGGMEREADAPIDFRGTAINLFANTAVRQRLVLPRDGDYRIEVVASGDQAGDEAPRMTIEWDDRPLQGFEVPDRRPRPFTQTVAFVGGAHTLTISYRNDYYEPTHRDPRRRDRNLQVHGVRVIGPVDLPALPNAAWLFAADPGGDDIGARARAMATALAERVFRRPATAAEVERLAALATAAHAAGEAWPAAFAPAVTAALCSPNFLFRIEPTDGSLAAGAESDLDGHRIASRLSFFLWSSCPDAALLQAAAAGELATADGIEAQLRRMLADPRADALATDFAAQWFELRALADRTPDATRFPGFDPALRASMLRETELLFLAILREGRDVRDLLDCGFTHVDARLAAHYGLPAPTAPGFQRVALDAEHRERGGILGHAGILVLTSNPTRTSPVKRGKWILENVLGAAPPAPEPGNDNFRDEAGIDSTATLRRQLEQHRSRPRCAGCHVRMDALGFALERFDPIGRVRTTDKGGTIDERGALPDGRAVDGVRGLAALLRGDPAFVRTALRKLFVYAVGRPPHEADALHLDAIADTLQGHGAVTVADLVRAVVLSPPFRRSTAPR